MHMFIWGGSVRNAGIIEGAKSSAGRSVYKMRGGARGEGGWGGSNINAHAHLRQSVYKMRGGEGAGAGQQHKCTCPRGGKCPQDGRGREWGEEGGDINAHAHLGGSVYKMRGEGGGKGGGQHINAHAHLGGSVYKMGGRGGGGGRGRRGVQQYQCTCPPGGKCLQDERGREGEGGGGGEEQYKCTCPLGDSGRWPVMMAHSCTAAGITDSPSIHLRP